MMKNIILPITFVIIFGVSCSKMDDCEMCNNNSIISDFKYDYNNFEDVLKLADYGLWLRIFEPEQLKDVGGDTIVDTIRIDHPGRYMGTVNGNPICNIYYETEICYTYFILIPSKKSNKVEEYYILYNLEKPEIIRCN